MVTRGICHSTLGPSVPKMGPEMHKKGIFMTVRHSEWRTVRNLRQSQSVTHSLIHSFKEGLKFQKAEGNKASEEETRWMLPLRSEGKEIQGECPARQIKRGRFKRSRGNVRRQVPHTAYMMSHRSPQTCCLPPP